MPLLDGIDPSDPANAAIIARLAATMGIGGAPDAGGFDARAGGMFGAAPPGLGILNGGAFPPPAPAVPLPAPRPDSAPGVPSFADRGGAMFAGQGIPIPAPRPAFAPGAPAAPGADAFASAAPGLAPGMAVAAAPSGEQPAVPDSSLLGRVKLSLSRLGDSIDSHPMTLMALGGGLAGAPSWGSGISRGLTAAAPASRLDMQYQLQQGGIQAAYSALQNHFASQGDDPGTAGKKALALVYNPEWMKTFGPQIFGPTEPKTVTYKDQNGIDRTAVYDPRMQQLRDIQTGAGIGPQLGAGGAAGQPSASPAGGGTAAAAGALGPSGAPAVPGNPAGTLAPLIMSRPGSSPPLAPPPAGTGNVPAWQEGQIAAANEASKHARTRAQGGEETIQKLTELEGMVRDAPEDAFGTFAGTDEGYLSGRTVNRLAGGMSVYTPGGASGRELLSAHERLKGAYAGAIEPLARAIGGGDPGTSGGRMNTAILDQAKAIIGGTETSDKETALKQIQDAKVRAWDGVQEGLRSGVYDPAKLPRASGEQGLEMGRGAIWVDGDGNIRRNKL